MSKINLVKVGNKLGDVEFSQAVLYHGYAVKPLTTNGEKGNKRSGEYALVAPFGSTKRFDVENGIITKIYTWEEA